MRLNVTTPPERWAGGMHNVSYDIDNRLFLTPDNLFYESNSVERIDAGLSNYIDGFNVYGGVSPQRMTRQNDHQLSLKRASFLWATLKTDAQPQPVQDRSSLRNDIPIPTAPILRDVPAGQAGYQAGTYNVVYGGAINFLFFFFAMTPPSPVAPVTLTAGQSIVIPFPSSVPASWPFMYIGLSDPATGLLWVQRFVDLSQGQADDIQLDGPFASIYQVPSANQTALGASKTPTVAAALAAFDLTPGEYAFYQTDATPQGETLPSNATPTTSVGATRSRQALYVSAGGQPSGATGWFCYAVQQDGRTYRVFPPGGSPDKPLSYSQPATVYSFDPSNWSRGSSAGLDWQVAQRDLPLADSSGLPAAQDPLDTPTALSNTGLHTDSPSKNFFVALAYTKNGVEGNRGPTAELGVVGGHDIRALLPQITNAIPNPDLSEMGQNGLPLEYNLYAGSTSSTMTATPGVIQISTTVGANAAIFPAGVVATPAIQVDRTEDYTFRGRIGVSNLISGAMEVVLQEFNTATPVLSANLPSPAPIRETIIPFRSGGVQITDVGTEDYLYTVPASSHFWLTSTVSAWVMHRPAGSSQSLTALISDIAIHPFAYAPPKVVPGDPRRGEADTLDAPPSFPYPKAPQQGRHLHRLAVLPQRYRANPYPDRPSSTGALQEQWTFEAGEDRSALALTKPLSTTTSEFVSPSAIDGLLGWHIRGTSTTQLEAAYYSRTFAGANRFTMGYQEKRRVRQLPPSGTTHTLWRIASATGAPLVVGSIDSSGLIWVTSYNRLGAVQLAFPVAQVGASSSNVLTTEAVVQGGGTNLGTVRVWFANSGNPGGAAGTSTKTLLYVWESIDWLDFYPMRYDFGMISESAASSTFEYDVDTVKITERGFSEVREFDELGYPIYQESFFVPPGYGPLQEVLPFLERFAVKPSTTYALGIYAAYYGVQGEQQPFYATLHYTDGTSEDVGCLLAPGGGPDGTVTGTAAWQEYTLRIDVPVNCFEVRLSGRNIGPGLYLYQEWCLTENSITPKRTGLRATSGTFGAIFDTATPKERRGRTPHLPRWWNRAGFEVETLEPGTSATAGFASSDTAGGFGIPTTDLSLAGTKRYLQVTGQLTGDGYGTPVIGPESPYLEQELAVATLLREDGSEFDGGTIVLGLHTPANLTPVQVTERIDKRVEREVLAAPVGTMVGFKVQTFTDAAAREIMEISTTKNLRVEGRGRAIIVKVKANNGQVTINQTASQQLRTIDENGNPYYYVVGVGDVPECEVVAEGTI